MKRFLLFIFLFFVSFFEVYADVDTFYVLTTDVYMRSMNTDYTTAHDMQKPNNYYNSTVTVSRIGQIGGTSKYIERTFVAIVTSDLAGMSISSVDLDVYVINDWSVTDFDISIMKGLWTSDPAESAKFEFGVGWDTSAVGGSLNTNGLGTGWKTITLDSLNWINKTGTTRFCLVSSRDLSRTISSGDEHIQINSANETLFKPRLIVNYTQPQHNIQQIYEPGTIIEEDSIRASNAPDHDTIDAYEAAQDDKNVHCSVLYFASQWNGYKYWMGYTPYPGPSVENPNIVVSQNGYGWAQPAGISNPINAFPGGDKYNSDIDIFMGLTGDTMYCGWRRYEGIGDSTIVLASWSANGTTWTDEDTLFADDDVQHTHLSPSWIWDNDDSVRCYYVSGGAAYVNHVWYRKANHPLATYNSPVQCTVHVSGNIDTLDNGRELWHPTMQRRGDTLFALVVMCDQATGGSNSRLHFARSTDFINFYMTEEPFIDLGQSGRWDDQDHYRSGMAWRSDLNRYMLFYTGNSGTAWKMGHTNLYITPPYIQGGIELYTNGEIFKIFAGD